MNRYRITMREIVYHTHEIETDLSDEVLVMEYFHQMGPQETIDTCVGTESDGWELDEIEEVSNA